MPRLIDLFTDDGTTPPVAPLSTWAHWRPHDGTPATHAHRWDGMACRCGYIPPFPAARIENSTAERCPDCS